jgi:transposase-like protein
MKRHSPKIVAKIIGLRKAGYSLAEISHITGISKNTIYHWVKTVRLTQKQKARLHKKEIRCGMAGLRKAHEIKKAKKIKWKRDVFSRAKKFKNIVNKKSALAKLLCGVLYLCEGAKYPSSRQMIFGNADPKIIKLFLCLLRNNFVIDESKIRCRIMHRFDQDKNELVKYWSRLARVPVRQFYKSYADKRSKGFSTKKPDYKGICAVQYNSTDLQYELQLIGETIFSIKD